MTRWVAVDADRLAGHLDACVDELGRPDVSVETWLDEYLAEHRARTLPLAHVPADGTWEILHGTPEPVFVAFTAAHPLAGLGANSGIMVVARPAPTRHDTSLSHTDEGYTVSCTCGFDHHPGDLDAALGALRAHLDTVGHPRPGSPASAGADRTLRAPWTEAEVELLNGFQRSRRFHPFTCPARDDHPLDPEGDHGVLVATTDGWVCRHCDYRQNWAHLDMLRPVPAPWPHPLQET